MTSLRRKGRYDFSMRTVLFVCSGNTCRSPMAEAIGRFQIESGRVEGVGKDIFVVSAGTGTVDGYPVSPEAIDALARLGIQHEGSSKRLTAQMVRKADLVLGMTAAHVAFARGLVERERAHCAKIFPMDKAGDVDDPIGLGAQAYDRLGRKLMELIPRRLSEMLKPS